MVETCQSYFLLHQSRPTNLIPTPRHRLHTALTASPTGRTIAGIVRGGGRRPRRLALPEGRAARTDAWPRRTLPTRRRRGTVRMRGNPHRAGSHPPRCQHRPHAAPADGRVKRIRKDAVRSAGGEPIHKQSEGSPPALRCPSAAGRDPPGEARRRTGHSRGASRRRARPRA